MQAFVWGKTTDDRTAAHTHRCARTLAYVYLRDGPLLNLEILRRGYGHAYTVSAQ